MANINQLLNSISSVRPKPADKTAGTEGTGESGESFEKLMADKTESSEQPRTEGKETEKDPSKTTGEDTAPAEEVKVNPNAGAILASASALLIEMEPQQLDNQPVIAEAADITRAAVESTIVTVHQEAVRPETVPVEAKTQVVQEPQDKGQTTVPVKSQEPDMPDIPEVPVMKTDTGKQDIVPDQSQKQEMTSAPPDQVPVTEKEAVVKNELKVETSDQNPEMPDTKEKRLDEHLIVREAETGGETHQTENVKTIKVKVAEPYRHMDQAAVKEFAGNISKGVADGVKELQIQLTPEHLGKVSIKISVMETGVKVLMSCDNQKTLNLLMEKAGSIEYIVESNTARPAVVEVKEDGYWNQQKDTADQNSGRNHQQQEKQQEKQDADAFAQQLRLGLVDGE